MKEVVQNEYCRLMQILNIATDIGEPRRRPVVPIATIIRVLLQSSTTQRAAATQCEYVQHCESRAEIKTKERRRGCAAAVRCVSKLELSMTSAKTYVAQPLD